MAEAGNIKVEANINIDVQEVKVKDLTREHIGMSIWTWNGGWEELKGILVRQYDYEVVTSGEEYSYETGEELVLVRTRATLEDQLTPEEKNWLVYVLDTYPGNSLSHSIKDKLGL